MNIFPFQPLDATNLAELKVALNGFLQKGETIKLETKVQCCCMTPSKCKLPLNNWWVIVFFVCLVELLETQSYANLSSVMEFWESSVISIVVSSQSDPSILGGMIVSIGDKYVDMSTKTKIQKLTKLIKET